MNVGIIGAGKLGSALGMALSRSGFCISGVYSKNENSTRLLCKRLKIESKNSIEATIQQSDIIFLSVPDNVIGSVASNIASSVNTKLIEKKVFVHLSGALTSEVLKPLEVLGAYTASIHPIQTFADKDNGWQKLYNCFFGFEGCIEAKKHVETIVGKLDGKIISIKREQKSLYHAAACVISNYSVTLFYIMHQLLLKAGMDEEAATTAFLPLLKNTVNNIESLGCINALTGPISRGDNEVVKKHIDALSKQVPEFEEVYKMLGRQTVCLAKQRENLSEEDVSKLVELLYN